MKNPLLLLALAAVAAGGCQQASHSGPEFAAGMSRVNYAVGFSSAEADGAAFTSATGGAPSLVDNVLSDVVVSEYDAINLAASYGLMVSDSIELGSRIGFGQAGVDNLTESTTDFDGDGFNDRAVTNGVASDSDDTYFTFGGFSRWYVHPLSFSSITPWAQFDFGYYTGDVSGLYYGGSLGASWFLSDSSALEARIFGETISDDDDVSNVGLEVGYSIFR